MTLSINHYFNLIACRHNAKQDMHRQNAAKFSQPLKLFRSRINTDRCTPENSNLHSHFFAKGGIQFQGFHAGLSLIRRQIKMSKSLSLLMLLNTTVVWIMFYKPYLTYLKGSIIPYALHSLDRWILIFVLICMNTSWNICKTLNDIKALPIKIIFKPLMKPDSMFHKIQFWFFLLWFWYIIVGTG